LEDLGNDEREGGREGGREGERRRGKDVPVHIMIANTWRI
jgi:hypothetical protein